VAIQPAQVSRPPGDVCIKLNTSERIPIISAVVSGESNWRGQILRTLVCVHERALEAFGPHPAEARLSIRRVVPCRRRVECRWSTVSDQPPDRVRKFARKSVAVEMSQVSPLHVMYRQGEYDIILV
jgi:hypothetical protein